MIFSLSILMLINILGSQRSPSMAETIEFLEIYGTQYLNQNTRQYPSVNIEYDISFSGDNELILKKTEFIEHEYVKHQTITKYEFNPNQIEYARYSPDLNSFGIKFRFFISKQLESIKNNKVVEQDNDRIDIVLILLKKNHNKEQMIRLEKAMTNLVILSNEQSVDESIFDEY